ncbi:MAG: GvpL/GvpF family gas vesicle protein [Polyangiaceae bacterium]
MSRAQAPLVSVDRAYHLVAVADEEFAGRRLRVEGERISFTRYEHIALLLRTVDADVWSSPTLELKKNDAGWLEREARLHEAIVARAMIQGTVVPVQPFTVFPDSSALDVAIRTHYTRFRRSVTRIAGKAEWAVHVYRGPHRLPELTPYLLRTTLSRAREDTRKVARPHGDHVLQVWKACSALATAARRIEALGDPHQLFCAAFLVPQTRRDEFRETLEGLHPQAKELGLTYYLEGPRPAFNFI